MNLRRAIYAYELLTTEERALFRQHWKLTEPQLRGGIVYSKKNLSHADSIKPVKTHIEENGSISAPQAFRLGFTQYKMDSGTFNRCIIKHIKKSMKLYTKKIGRNRFWFSLEGARRSLE